MIWCCKYINNLDIRNFLPCFSRPMQFCVGVYRLNNGVLIPRFLGMIFPIYIIRCKLHFLNGEKSPCLNTQNIGELKDVLCSFGTNCLLISV